MKILELPFNPDCKLKEFCNNDEIIKYQEKLNKLKYYSKSDKLDMLINDTNAGYILKNKLYNL